MYFEYDQHFLQNDSNTEDEEFKNFALLVTFPK